VLFMRIGCGPTITTEGAYHEGRGSIQKVIFDSITAVRCVGLQKAGEGPYTTIMLYVKNIAEVNILAYP